MIYKNKMVTLKNLILKYIGMKNINIHLWIEKEVSCSNKCNVFIETVWCMFHEKHFIDEHACTVLTFTYLLGDPKISGGETRYVYIVVILGGLRYSFRIQN